jgi:hypothetical protein
MSREWAPAVVGRAGSGSGSARLEASLFASRARARQARRCGCPHSISAACYLWVRRMRPVCRHGGWKVVVVAVASLAVVVWPSLPLWLGPPREEGAGAACAPLPRGLCLLGLLPSQELHQGPNHAPSALSVNPIDPKCRPGLTVPRGAAWSNACLLTYLPPTQRPPPLLCKIAAPDSAAVTPVDCCRGGWGTK